MRTVIRTEGTGVFLDSSTVGVPRFVEEFAAYTHSLTERIVLLTFVPMNVSHVNKDRRTVAIRLGHGFWRVRCRFGYLDQVAVEDALNEAGRRDLAIDRDMVIYFLRRFEISVGSKGPMLRWRARLFRFCSVNSLSQARAFEMPPGRIVVINNVIEF